MTPEPRPIVVRYPPTVRPISSIGKPVGFEIRSDDVERDHDTDIFPPIVLSPEIFERDCTTVEELVGRFAVNC